MKEIIINSFELIAIAGLIFTMDTLVTIKNSRH